MENMENKTDKIVPLSFMRSFVFYLKRLGLAAFLFFLIKGLVWIAIFLGAGKLFL